MNNEQVSLINTLAGVIAVYGVYALVPLAIFLLLSTYKDYKNAATEDIRRHNAGVHWVFVAFTIVISIAAVWIWSASTLFNQPMLEGSITGLIDQSSYWPQRSSSGVITQSIEALGLQGEFYNIRREENVSRGTYEVRWVILPGQTGVSKLTLRIAQRYQRVGRSPAFKDPTDAALITSSDTIDLTPRKDFVLDFDSLPELQHHHILISYDGPSGSSLGDSIGTLFVTTKAGRKALIGASVSVANAAPVDLDRRLSRTTASVNALLGFLASPVAPAYAQAEFLRGIFSGDSASDARTSDAIVKVLQSADPHRRSNMRAILVAEGSKSCEFVRRTLTGPAVRDAVDKGLLLQNLSDIVQGIEQQDPHACTQTYLPFALAYYDLDDFKSSAAYFEVAPASEVTGNLLFSRGFAFYQAGGHDAAAIESLKMYVAHTGTSPAGAAGLFQLGLVYTRLNQGGDALRSYREVLNTPGIAGSTKAVASNNIAYLYTSMFSDRKDSLTSALKLVGTALKFASDYGSFLDTKGWILFKLGRCREAATLVSRAQLAEPADSEIQSHVDQIRRTTRTLGSCN